MYVPFSSMDCFLNYLQKFTELPAVYATLKDVALKCLDNIRFDVYARKVFTTGRVWEVLNDVMALTIKALECISIHYSRAKFCESISVASVVMCSSIISTSRLERRRGEGADGEAAREREAYPEGVLG